MALDDDQKEDVFSGETEPEPEGGGNGDEQSNRSFRMMVLGLGGIGALGVLLIALIFLSRQGERNQIAQQNQAIQATNTAIAMLSQITPTPPPTITLMPTNTAAPTNTPVSSPQPVQKDIVDTALAAGNFKTFATALQTAGLVDALKGKGPFTVFAPTDDAFAKLPAGTLDALLKDPKKLSDILKYHVVEGAAKAADVAKLTSAKTLEGEPITITVSGDTAMINDARVTTPDIEATNGVIHVIDKVLLPPEMQASVAPQATSATAGGKPATTVAQAGPTRQASPTTAPQAAATAVAQAEATKQAASTTVAQAEATKQAATAVSKPATSGTVVPTRLPPAAATATAAASAGITSTQPISGTTGTGGGMPPTGASDLTWVLLAVGLVAVLIIARRMRTSQS